jgi:hypothetical protein
MRFDQFAVLPGSEVRRHILKPLVIFGLVLLGAVGELGRSKIWEQIGSPHSDSFHPLLSLYPSSIRRALSTPQVCHQAPGKLNPIQAQHCHEYLRMLFADLTLASIPVLIPLLLYFTFAVWASFIYQAAHRKLKTKNIKVIGVLTEPMELPMDSFAWFACLRPVMVQLKEGRQIKVYLSCSDHTSAPGRRVALFKLFSQGKKRYVAIPYLPELSVRGHH